MKKYLFCLVSFFSILSTFFLSELKLVQGMNRLQGKPFGFLFSTFPKPTQKLKLAIDQRCQRWNFKNITKYMCIVSQSREEKFWEGFRRSNKSPGILYFSGKSNIPPASIVISSSTQAASARVGTKTDEEYSYLEFSSEYNRNPAALELSSSLQPHDTVIETSSLYQNENEKYSNNKDALSTEISISKTSVAKRNKNSNSATAAGKESVDISSNNHSQRKEKKR